MQLSFAPQINPSAHRVEDLHIKIGDVFDLVRRPEVGDVYGVPASAVGGSSFPGLGGFSIMLLPRNGR